MPGRKFPIVNGEIYHVFNRGINRQPVFVIKNDYQRAVKTFQFYRFQHPPLKLSKFLLMDMKRREDFLKSLAKRIQIVQILAFCLMPNHFHLLLKQTDDNGITKFLSNFQNSYTRYFDTKHDRDGSIFLNQFKAVRLETDEQLLHVSRYIHLNPYTGYVVKSLPEVLSYSWSSLQYYQKGASDFMNLDLILSFFKGYGVYEKFIFDQADYQRELKQIEHLTFEYY